MYLQKNRILPQKNQTETTKQNARVKKNARIGTKKTTENCHFLFVDFLSFFSVIFFLEVD